MTTTVEKRPSVASRRAGYVAGALINAVLLWLIHVWPGWDAVPFLTADFETVLWLINLSLVVTIALNLLYLIRDPRWLTAAGAVVTTAIGLTAAIRMLQVFPFDLGDSGFWPVVFRVLLWVAIVGAIIGLIANVVALVRALCAR
jgi:hypothetical protein